MGEKRAACANKTGNCTLGRCQSLQQKCHRDLCKGCQNPLIQSCHINSCFTVAPCNIVKPTAKKLLNLKQRRVKSECTLHGCNFSHLT